MRRGMAAEIQKVRIAKQNGQPSIFDVYEAKELLQLRPCIFDRVDHLVLEDDTYCEDENMFDPEIS